MLYFNVLILNNLLSKHLLIVQTCNSLILFETGKACLVNYINVILYLKKKKKLSLLDILKKSEFFFFV